MAKDSVAISISHLNPCRTPDTKGIPRGRPTLATVRRAAPFPLGGWEISPSGSPPGPEDVHGLAVLFGVQADLEVGLHLQPECLEVQVEGAGGERVVCPAPGPRRS